MVLKDFEVDEIGRLLVDLKLVCSSRCLGTCFKRYMDVINLGCNRGGSLKPCDIDRHLDRCRELLSDRTNHACHPFVSTPGFALLMKMLKLLWENLLKYVQADKIDGYTAHLEHTRSAWYRNRLARSAIL